jgi:plastocyanin
MRRALAFALAAIAAAAFAAPARADTGSAVIAFNQMFLPGDPGLPAQTSPSIKPGQSLLFLNVDAACTCDHTITSVAKKPNNTRLFDTSIVHFSANAEVAGVPALPAGSYPFFCGVHPTMRGTLVVG